ncbi:MAG TPA: thioesterase family protein [Candidatus Sulfotelmatobacter sp.]|nr:thioesterase family protein [Candidatus Sulfotelmatobacter sp.]HWI57257.1 thioesterase family protein [Bacillota bacterium]
MMSGSTYIHSHRVTYADCTAGNHIYYGRYLDLLEAARGEFFRHLGTTFRQWQEQDRTFPVVECRLRYHSPARYDDTLRIEVWLTAAEGARLNFGYRMLQADSTLVLTGETLHVCANVAGRPKRLPAELVSKVAAFLQ